MLSHVAVSAERHEILERIITPLAPLDLVMDLEIFQRAALLTSPSVLLQHPLHQPPVDFKSQLCDSCPFRNSLNPLEGKLPKRIGHWSLTSLQQRLVKTGGRLVKYARYYWLLLAESHLTRRLFGAMVGRIE